MSEIEEFMNRLHPKAQEVVRTSLLLTVVNMVKRHRDDKEEIEQIEAECNVSDQHGTW